MYDRLRWGKNSIYGEHTLEVHFKTDDEAPLELCDRARQLGHQISVCQVAGREGLTVFVIEVQSNEICALVGEGAECF